MDKDELVSTTVKEAMAELGPNMTEGVQTHHGSTQWACSTVRGPSNQPVNVLSRANLLKCMFYRKCPGHADGQEPRRFVVGNGLVPV